MNRLLDSEDTPFVRCDYSDQDAWERVRAAVVRSDDPESTEFFARVDVVEDPSYAGLAPGQLLELLPVEHHHAILIVADKRTLTEVGNPLLVIDLLDNPGRQIRVIAEQAWSIENNLSIGNMYFQEFVEAVGEDGIFRGFGA
jgi:hypothetical protein